MLKIEAEAVSKNERLRIYRSILLQPFTYYKIDSNKRVLQYTFNKKRLYQHKGLRLKFLLAKKCFWQ